MPKCTTGQIVSISFPIFLKRKNALKVPAFFFYLKSYPFPCHFVNNKSSSFLTITKIVSTFFSLQKLEALDFITMLSQWSSFSSQKVQIRFFCTESRFPADIYTGFLLFSQKVSHSPNPVCCCPRGKMLFWCSFLLRISETTEV